jgi:cysteinyl-tRNA synthetase
MKVFNTLSGNKEEFLSPGSEVKIYVCGITSYDFCHIGHAASYIFFDVVRRYLAFKGYKVKYVQNFTDVDDKIINQAQSLGISCQELSQRFISEYFLDMDSLNILRADVYPRASEEIPQMLHLIQGLMEKGYAYQGKDGIYFRVRKCKDYGKLSHQDIDSLTPQEAGEKESPLDFALWKFYRPGEPYWESPWGKGRPGWHIECSAMALKYLGETLDIHGGGEDLIFPHHENEIAQSECFTGVPFARYWLHNGMVRLGSEKMSKSLGNLVSVRQSREMFDADTIRLFVLSSHYRSPITYTEEILQSCRRGAERLREATRAVEGGGGDKVGSEIYRQRFMKAMDDDLNTPQALASLFDLAHEINRGASLGSDVVPAQNCLKDLCHLLGLQLTEERAKLEGSPFIDLLVSIRDELRRKREFELADSVRSRLKELGITLEDTPQKTIWKVSG